jgi:plasmid maintenance system killer protein
LGATIELKYGDEGLERDCRSRRALKRRYGALAQVMERRLTSLYASANLAELAGVPGRFERLRADRRGQFSMRLDRNVRLVFEVADEPVPMRGNEIDLARVTAVRILEVVDYHGD